MDRTCRTLTVFLILALCASTVYPCRCNCNDVCICDCEFPAPTNGCKADFCKYFDVIKYLGVFNRYIVNVIFNKMKMYAFINQENCMNFQLLFTCILINHMLPIYFEVKNRGAIYWTVLENVLVAYFHLITSR